MRFHFLKTFYPLEHAKQEFYLSICSENPYMSVSLLCIALSTFSLEIKKGKVFTSMYSSLDEKKAFVSMTMIKIRHRVN